jgi:hypothetical protein
MVQTRTEEIKAAIDGLRDDYLVILEILHEWGEKFSQLRGLISEEQHRLDPPRHPSQPQSWTDGRRSLTRGRSVSGPGRSSAGHARRPTRKCSV